MDSKNIKTLLSEEYLVVPEIQREYVWGLKGNKDKLLYFINDIDNTAINSEKNIGFLYTYHAKDNECYIIDGQQRFTTVILLMYALALKDGREEAWNLFDSLLNTSEPKLKFSYNVRPLTEEFLHHLFKEHIFVSLKELRNNRWYINAYSRDITISAILQALETLMDMNLTISLSQVVENIKFWYFKVEETSQGEELYISMNSRGKKLPIGDQIKPLLIQKAKKEAGYSYRENEVKKAWDVMEDWFFAIRKYIDKKISVDDVENYAMTNIINMAIEISQFSSHRVLNPIKDSTIATLRLPLISELVDSLRKLLECGLLSYSDMKVLYSTERVMRQWLKIEILLADRHSENIDNKKRLVRIVENTLKYIPNSTETAFLLFARLVSEMPKEKKLFKYLSEHKDELEYIDGDNKNSGFIPREEMEKISFLSTNEDKENVLVEAEKYAFFDGRIHFLYHDEDGNVDWENFDVKYAHAKMMFNAEGAQGDFYKESYIQRLIISFFDKWEYFSAICFDRTKNNLLNMLLNNSITSPIAKTMLINDYPILDGYQSNDELTNSQRQLKNEIVGTKWFEYILEGNILRNPWDNQNYHFFCYNGKANWRHYYLVHKRNGTINALVQKGVVNTECLMKSGFCYGDYVYFSYKGKWFYWTSDNYIYYAQGNNQNAYRRSNSYDNDSRVKKYYCLDVSSPEISSETLIANLSIDLDRLISEKSL